MIIQLTSLCILLSVSTPFAPKAYGTVEECGTVLRIVDGPCDNLIFPTPLTPRNTAHPHPLDEQLLAAEAQRIEAIARALPACVSVFAPGGTNGGSAVLISSDGLALTNYHVVQPCGVRMQCSLPDGQLYDAVLVGFDPTGDLALIKLLGRDDFPVAEWANSDSVRAGQPCFAVGNPFLLGTDYQPTVTWGTVSGVGRYQYPAGTLLEYTDCIQTDAAINPGNSGGPLFDQHGRLIGINGRCSFDSRGRVNVGVGYAISANQARMFVDHLASGRVVDHATLGATVHTQAPGVVVVTEVAPGSPVARRGLRAGDRIVNLAGREIRSANQLQNILGTFPAGWRVPLEFIDRDDRVVHCVVTLQHVHHADELWEQVGGIIDVGPLEFHRRQPTTPDDQTDDDCDIPDAPPRPWLPPDSGPTARLAANLSNIETGWFEPRKYFANYYFNRLRLKDLRDRTISKTAVTPGGGRWILGGTSGDGDPWQMILDTKRSGLRLEQQAAVNDGTQSIAQMDLAPNADGARSALLAAMHVWRQWVLDQASLDGHTHYVGSLPLFDTLLDHDAQDFAQLVSAPAESIDTDFHHRWLGAPMAEVVETDWAGDRYLLFFDRVHQRLAQIEIHWASDRDPWVVQLTEYQDFEAGELPAQVVVGMCGHPPVLALDVERFDVEQFDSQEVE